MPKRPGGFIGGHNTELHWESQGEENEWERPLEALIDLLLFRLIIAAVAYPKLLLHHFNFCFIYYWRKLKGTVRLANGRVYKAEVHWYEAHGVCRKKFKIKRYLE
ncbi:hypothetical protein DCC62_29335 [candidate division KSB1 bacterium]|nr:MAG: hypothetical protein DCC62_29335 [candidate division KSB1 bacterium]